MILLFAQPAISKCKSTLGHVHLHRQSLRAALMGFSVMLPAALRRCLSPAPPLDCQQDRARFFVRVREAHVNLGRTPGLEQAPEYWEWG